MSNNSDTGFIHTVFFWLTEEATEQDRLAFEKGLQDLGQTPSIQKWHYGQPANTNRPVIDSSYDYAWICHFRNAQDQDEYQDHPIHHVFVDKYKHLWAKVQVYDTLL